MGKQVHVVRDVDPSTRTGTCSECGPGADAVRHGRRADGRQRWLCRVTHRVRDRRYREMREAGSRMRARLRRRDRARVVATLVRFMDGASITDLARMSGLRGDDLRRFAAEWAEIADEQRERVARLSQPSTRRRAERRTRRRAA